MSDDGTEELAQPADRSSQRRLRLDIAVGAVILLAILLLTRHHDGTGAPGPPPTPAAPVSTAPPSTLHVLDHQTLPARPVPDRHAGDVARCPRGLDCPVAKVASAGIQSALEAAFPGVRIDWARTERAVVTGYGEAIWSAAVRARAGDQLIRLRLQPISPEDHARHRTTLLGGHAVTHWDGMLAQLLVVIDVVAPADAPASLSAIEQLARDARLTSPW